MTEPRQVPIAVVGLGAMLPGSKTPDGFWRDVVNGRDLITDVPSTHWLAEDYFDPDPAAPEKVYTQRGAFLDPVPFDSLLHGIPPAALRATDTSQLLAMMVADQTLTDAFRGRPRPDGERTSVVLGTAAMELLSTMSNRLQRPVWYRALRESGLDEATTQRICDRIAEHYVPWQGETFPGVLSNVVSGRVANRFDLHGTNHTADAACASSFAAMTSAMNELALGQSDLALSGGVDTLNDIVMYMCFAETRALSRSGDARPFAARADGTILGEGLVMFALKRLADAERDGDEVYGVLRGFGASSDGSGVAIYEPRSSGQTLALRRAYQAAAYSPDTVELVEAHGTGTVAGDAAEVKALREVFGESTRRDRPWCALGSVKSQLGHTKSAAGAVGLLKALLAAHHGVLPPTIKVDHPNPALELDESPLYVNTRARPWVRGQDHPRRASVSSFGFGGSNFHLTLEEYRSTEHSAARPGRRLRVMPAELILLSAESPTDLIRDAEHVASQEHSLATIAHRTQRSFRATDSARASVIATDPDDLRAKLGRIVEQLRRSPYEAFSHPGGVHCDPTPASPGELGLLFSGQGSQYVHMGADIAMTFPEALSVWDRLASERVGDQRLHEVVFPPAAFTEHEREAQRTLLTSTEWAQPAVAVQSLALLSVLEHLGLKPACVGGHSFGELSALCAAGAMSAETLVNLARIRGELMRDAPERSGGMCALKTSTETTQEMISGENELWIANHNSPGQVVVSGTEEGLVDLERRASERNITTRRLDTATGFHSPLVSSARTPFRQVLDETELTTPEIPVLSNIDAEPYTSEMDMRRRLAEHLVRPVRFVDQIEAMYRRGIRTFVEVGAGAAQTGLIKEILSERSHLAVSLDQHGGNGVWSLYEALGKLSVHGFTLDFDVLWKHYVIDEEPMTHDPRRTAEITGTNYGKPYPPSASDPANGEGANESPAGTNPVAEPETASTGSITPSSSWNSTEQDPPLPTRPPSLEDAPPADEKWSYALQEMQRYTAEVHAAYQRSVAESHTAFLRFAENSIAHLASAAGAGPIAPGENQAPPSAPDPLPPAPSFAAPAPRTGSPTSGTGTPPSPPPPPETRDPVRTEPEPGPPVQQSPDPAESSSQGLEATLMSIVADKTGYPAEMLEPEMELTSDLGLDSIKRVEILSALREQVPDLPEVDAAELGKMRSLSDVLTTLSPDGDTDNNERISSLSAQADIRPPPSSEKTTATSTLQKYESTEKPLTRLARRVTPREAPELCLPGLPHGPVTILREGGGIAEALASRLREHGVPATVSDTVPTDGARVVFLGGLTEITSEEQALAVNRTAFRIARQVGSVSDEPSPLLVTVQDTGGDFGIGGGDALRVWSGGMAALTRTCGHEWPGATTKAIDCERGRRSSEQIAESLCRELLEGGSVHDVGLRSDDQRFVLEVAPVPGPGEHARNPITSDSVLVVSGGGRGITAKAARALARARGPRLALLGHTPLEEEPERLRECSTETELKRVLLEESERSPTPAEIRERSRRIMAMREIRTTVDALREEGIEVDYWDVDVTDHEAVDVVLRDVRRRWGRITGVVHGAGRLADALVTDKTDDVFNRVFDTKVSGLRSLLAATEQDPLELLCAFSSVAAVFGNSGQSDYAMANEVLGHVLRAQRHRRPECRTASIAWGPWEGGMVTAELSAHFHGRGIETIPPELGAQAFVTECERSSEPEPIVLADSDSEAWSGDMHRASEGEVRIDTAAHPQLWDHAIANQPVLPLALAAEWLMSIAHLHRRAGGTQLREVAVLQTVHLDSSPEQPRWMRVGAEPTEQSGIVRVHLTSPEGTHCYRATAEPLEGEEETRPLPTDLEVLEGEIYDGTVLFHGPRFRVIEEVVGIGPTGAVGTVTSVRNSSWSSRRYRTEPAGVDGGLQLALLWADHVLDRPTLPMSVRVFRVHGEDIRADGYRCVVRHVRTDTDSVECDITLSANGDIYAELLGVRLVNRPDVTNGSSSTGERHVL
ncbi:type I polyketide synthase [Actinopolyspora mortivallis]|uniref:Beta keto-acyl synthase n=1 Tax=Actinopolyspora mortivallis TaxID=33906 RepID=A0A2T0GWL7_ACTMO|nr:type I polyketide synthase [Actinopolyspora mortivallis]PRW63502.1 beta keto-acyl synthase [Actinopolyspora mortivallis]